MVRIWTVGVNSTARGKFLGRGVERDGLFLGKKSHRERGSGRNRTIYFQMTWFSVLINKTRKKKRFLSGNFSNAIAPRSLPILFSLFFFIVRDKSIHSYIGFRNGKKTDTKTRL